MTKPPPHVVFKAVLVVDGPACFIPLPFNPKAVFGKVRAPVKVTLNGYTLSQHDCRDGRAAVHCGSGQPS